MRYIRDIRTGVRHIKAKTLTSIAIVGISVMGLTGAAVFPAFASAAQQSVVYNNIPSPTPSNVPSFGFEATSLSELGSQVHLDGSARKNPEVTVLMSSFACKSGSWNAQNCLTNSGSTFTHPVTVNVYNVSPDDSPGTVIKSVTKTFTMPYRPTADDGTNCNGVNAGKWWDGAACVNGKAFKISFDLDGVTLPDDVIVSVAYNTTNHGNAPIGTQACNTASQGCPYDSLNVGTSGAPSVGSSEPTNKDAYANSSWAGFYCDSDSLTPGPVGVFRLDSGCWTSPDGTTPVIPAIKVEASPGQDRNHGRNDHHHNHHDGDKDHHKNFGDSHGFNSLWNR
jgi:hypothetical protein